MQRKKTERTERVTMKYHTTVKNLEGYQDTDTLFDPRRLVSDEEYNRNLNLLIAYYQMTRGASNRRFRRGS
jgi:hypothetical protein